MKNVEIFIPFTLVIICLIGYPGVDGATCTTDSTCQTTDFTLSTCSSSKVCDCLNSSYVAIRSGCALKLDKPKITSMSGYSNQVVATKSFTLNCVVLGADLFEWYKGGTKLSTTTSTYTDTASASTVGVFTCKGLVKDTTLVSDLSDAFTVEMLGTDGSTTSSVQPTIYVPATSVIKGSSITLQCQNIPMGYTETISYKVDGSAGTETFVVDASNADKTVACQISNPSTGYTFSALTSANGKLPSAYDNIQSVTVKVNNMAVTEVIGTSIELTCSTSPQDPYLASLTLTYTWLKDGSATGLPTTATFTPTESGTYSCTAQLSSLTKLTSVTVKVTIDNILLETSSSMPIKGGRVILTCGEKRTDGTTYTWTKDAKPIARQFDRRLQLDNFDTTDDGIYACQASGNQFYLRSNTINLETQTSIFKPSIEQIGSILCSESFFEKGDYWLVCDTSSETIGMTYEWTVKGVASTTATTKYYTLKDISSLNTGDYTCKAKFGTYSTTSSTKTVTVIKPGLLCRHDNVCIAAKTGYTGKCDTNDRCTCSDGYWQEGEVCTNGVLALMSSSITMAAILLFSKLF